MEGLNLRRTPHYVGAGFSHGFSWADVFASYVEFVAGSDTHAGGAFTAGLSFPVGRTHP